MEKILWLLLGGVAFVAAFRAGRSRRALVAARIAVGALMIGAGALVNAIYLATGLDWTTFADTAHVDFVRDAWRSVVAPNHVVFITLLIMFEATAGVLVLHGGRKAQFGYLALIGMHIGLIPFGWVFTVWAAVMLVAFTLLLRAERHPPAGGDVSQSARSAAGDELMQTRPAGVP